MDRRTFLLTTGATVSVVSSPVFTPLKAAAFNGFDGGVKPQKHLLTDFNKHHWSTIAAVQNHLFPTESHAPGAAEINATTYLHDYLSNPFTDPMDAKFIHQGVIKLDQLATTETRYQFIELATEKREQILRQYEQQSEGRRWLITVLNYILEALLTDPVYGGNTNRIGWKWLEHRAGEPRPPLLKRYWLL